MPVNGGARTFDAVFQLALKAAAVGGSLGGAAVLYGLSDRLATARKLAFDAARQGERDEADDGKQLRAELRGDLAQIRKCLSDEMKDHQATRADRDRGWALARWWNKKAFFIQHACFNARTAAEQLCTKINIDPPPWRNDITLPEQMEDPIRSHQPSSPPPSVCC
jgi:hypothetical protein